MAVTRSRSFVNVWLIPGSGLLAFSLFLATCRSDATAPNPATRLAFTVQPTTTVAGHRITPAVQVAALDASGNVVPGFRGTVTLTADTGTSGPKLTVTVVSATVEGVADFAALSIDKSGTGYTLTAATPGLAAATSAAFDVNPGAATRLGFTAPPAKTTAGATMAPVQVAAQDSLGNTVPGFTDSVTVSISAGTGPAGAALSGSRTVAAVAGVAEFSTLSIDQSGTAYKLSATATALAGATSAPFAITAGSATQLAFIVQPKTTTGGATIAPAVQVVAQDPLGNLVPDFAGSVTVTITPGTGPAGAKLSGATTLAAVGGTATFSALSVDRTGTVKSRTAYTLSATATDLVDATSDPFEINPGSPARLAFTIQPATTQAGARLAPPVEVTALDSVGNLVPSFNGNVTVAIGTNPSDGVLSGTKMVAAVAGVATFSTLGIDKIGTGYTLLATANGLSDTSSAAFDVTPGSATRLVFTVQPSKTTAGGTIRPAVRVTALDEWGNIATGFTHNVTVAIANPVGGTLSGTRTVAAVAGVATFSSLSIHTAGPAYTLSAAAENVTGDTSALFDIVPSEATRLEFTVQPTSASAGATIAPAVQVTVRDDAGNVVPSFTDSVTVAIAPNPAGVTLSGAKTVAAVGGVATFSDLSLDRSGTGYTLIAGASGLTGAISEPFGITPRAATRLVFTVQPSTAKVGMAITPQVEVTALDSLGNTATQFTDNVTLTITAGTDTSGAGLVGSTTAAAVAGVAAFSNLSIDKGGAGYTLSARAGSMVATSAQFDITAALATQLVFTVQPTATTAGATIGPAVQVTARDPSGRTVTTFSGNVTLTITARTGPSGARLLGATTVAAIGGVATFSSLSIEQSGSGYTLSATANGLSGTTSAPFAITPGQAARLVFTAEPRGGTAGTPLTPAVQVSARDAWGNAVPGFADSVTVAIDTNLAGGALSGTTTVAAVGGVATFSDLRVDRSGSGYTLTARAALATGAVSASFAITPGPATRLVFTVQPSTARAGTRIIPDIEVTALDSLGNTATQFTNNVTVEMGTSPAGGTLSGDTTVAAVAGVATFSNLSVDKSGTGYTLLTTAGNLSRATSAAFAITPGPATRLVFTAQPTAATAGGTIKPAVRVTALDALGNIATGFAGNVTVAIGTGPVGGKLSGTRTFAAIAGVATFPSLNIDSVGSYTLSATAAGLTADTSASFDIVVSSAVRLVFTTSPADSQPAGDVIAPQLQVTAQDASGRAVTTFSGNVTLAIVPGTGVVGATLSGDTTVAAVGGVATFSNLSINKAEAWYTLSATTAGLQPTSTSFRVVAGPAEQLTFRVPPSTATVKATIAPQVEVTARDRLGNLATSFADDVTAAIEPNPWGGVLSGTATVTAVAGVATFRTLSIDRAGSDYTLTATAPGLRATSAPFEITAERASQLVFTVQPTSTTAGVAIAAVKVTARDASGQTATNFAGNVTLTITAGTGTRGATLTGTATVAAVAGVATFSTLEIDQAGSAYRLSATAPGLAGTTSASFTINPGKPVQLTFTPQRIPGLVDAPWPTAGEMIAPPIPVVVRDALGNGVESFAGGVTVAIAKNPGGGTLSGTTTVPTLAGLATFNDLSIDRSGTGYQLQATATGLSPALSNGFVVTAGPPAQLLFTVQPSTTAAGATMKPAVRVTAFDALGNPATGFTGDVTVAITAGTGGGTGGATLLGTLRVPAVNGVAIFSNLVMDQAESGYTLSASAPGLTPATSTPFDIH